MLWTILAVRKLMQNRITRVFLKDKGIVQLYKNQCHNIIYLRFQVFTLNPKCFKVNFYNQFPNWLHFKNCSARYLLYFFLDNDVVAHLHVYLSWSREKKPKLSLNSYYKKVFLHLLVFLRWPWKATYYKWKLAGKVWMTRKYSQALLNNRDTFWGMCH